MGLPVANRLMAAGARPIDAACRSLAAASGHSLRETAVALFGRETVDREWHQPSDHLKMRTRRFISHARRLAEGGYRDLL
jgi:hypothetical protein